MREIGVDVVRISPQAFHTAKILRLFHEVMENRLPAQTAMQQMATLMPDQACDGYWHGRPGIEQSYLRQGCRRGCGLTGQFRFANRRTR